MSIDLNTPIIMPLWGEADGYDGNGLDSEGYNRNGFREDEDGTMVDRDGYNEDGFKPDRWGDLRDQDGYDEDGYNEDGRDAEGYNEDGYNEDGYDRGGYDEGGYDEEGVNRYGEHRDDCDCDDCNGNCEWLMYDNPELIFKHTMAEEEAAEGKPEFVRSEPLPGVPYFGVEIEMTSACTESERSIIYDDYGDLFWAKEDGSVEGFEMVSHPFTAAWAREHFPFKVVAELREVGASVISSTNGLHIHVSRDGFSSWAHQFRWVKFFYNLEEQLTGDMMLGGRRAESWGSFRQSDRDEQFAILKNQMGRAHGRFTRGHMARRYAALNLQNDNTIEARVFASTTHPARLRQRLELVMASVEYTRNLTVAEIRAGGWEWKAFLVWLSKNEALYPALAARVVPEGVMA